MTITYSIHDDDDDGGGNDDDDDNDDDDTDVSVIQPIDGLGH